jgi:hypothetical protein
MEVPLQVAAWLDGALANLPPRVVLPVMLAAYVLCVEVLTRPRKPRQSRVEISSLQCARPAPRRPHCDRHAGWLSAVDPFTDDAADRGAPAQEDEMGYFHGRAGQARTEGIAVVWPAQDGTFADNRAGAFT